MSTKSYYRLLDTAVDGRCSNVFYRQQQLRQLHDALIASKEELLDAISADCANATAEIWIEYYLAISAAKSRFDTLNPERSLREEYRIAHETDAVDAREPAGIVYIEPTTHTLLYSAVLAVCSAIAAGNCVALVLEQTLRKTPATLQKILKAALDPDLIDIIPSKITDAGFLDSCVQVIQEESEDKRNKHKVLMSLSKTLTIGIVDRTADVEKAAKALVDARFRFGGKSPYAPDIVFVNEFLKGAFKTAALKHAFVYMSEENDKVNLTQSRVDGKQERIEGMRFIAGGSNGAVLEVTSRTALGRLEKVREKSLRVCSISSIDDGINVANSLSKDQLLAVYVFGCPEVCKYALQFTNSRVGFANHVQTRLLAGPAAPSGLQITENSLLYPMQAFTIPKPAFSAPAAIDRDLERLLLQTKQDMVVRVEAEMLQKLEIPRDRKVNLLIGFFEQGILTGLGIIATPVLLGVGTLGYYGVTRFLLPRLR